MRAAVIVVFAWFVGCQSVDTGESADDPECATPDDCGGSPGMTCDEGGCRETTCLERLEFFSCDGENVTIGCVDNGADSDPRCFCDYGFANLTDAPGCEDPSPEYVECCECMEANTGRYNPCMEASATQCIQALEAGAEVSTDGACAQNECAGSCALVDCDAFPCTGY
jgi:hypothetical protein